MTRITGPTSTIIPPVADTKPTDDFTKTIKTIGLNELELRRHCVAITTLGYNVSQDKIDLAWNAIVELISHQTSASLYLNGPWWIVKMPTIEDTTYLIKASCVKVKPIGHVVFFRQLTIKNCPLHLISNWHSTSEAENVRNSLNNTNDVVKLTIRHTMKIQGREQTVFIINLNSPNLKLLWMKKKTINRNKTYFSILTGNNCRYCHSEDTHKANHCLLKALIAKFESEKWAHSLGDDEEAYCK